MPSYNHEKFISEAIESVLNQTFNDLELIIIDDKSNDGSPQIIEEFAKKDSRIRVFFHQNNMGISKTINEGLRNSKGRFTALIASDDLWVSEKLEKQVRILEEDEDLVVWCNSAIIDSESNLTGELSSEKYKNATPHGYVFEEIVNSWISGSGFMVKHDNIIDLPLNENLRYLNDTKLYLDLSYKFNFYYLKEPLSRYRLHETNSSSEDNKDITGWYKDSLLLCIYIFHQYGGNLSYKALKNIFYKTCMVPLMIGKSDMLNKSNIIYPLIIPLTFTALTIKNLPKIISKQ